MISFAKCLRSTRNVSPARPRETGFIIIAVLWILLALAGFASIYALYVGNSTVAARASTDRLEADALIAASLELTALQLSGNSDDDPRSVGEFRFTLADAEAAVAFHSEGGRIDLNAAPKELLAGLFQTLGAKKDDAAYFADRVVGWRTKSKDSAQNKEADAYKDAGLRYSPRQSPFQNVAELRFVLGLPPDLVDRAAPFITVFNGLPQVDARTAPPEVLQSLPHMTPDLLQTALAQRGVLGAKALTALFAPVKDSVSVSARKSARVDMALRLASGRRVSAEAVILLRDKDQDPYRVLAARDDFDGMF